MRKETRLASESGLSMAVVIAIVVVLAMAIGTMTPFILGYMRTHRRIAMVEECSKPLSSILDAETKIKKETSKFWRPEGTQTLSPEAAKASLGVDLSGLGGCGYRIYPLDLQADPTLRIAAHGYGEFSDLVVECTYDAPGNTRHCEEVVTKR